MTDKITDQMLDSLLEASHPDVPAGLAARVLADAPQAKSSFLDRISSALAPNGRRWPAGAALASLGVGLMSGYAATAQNMDTYTEQDAAIVTAFGTDYEALFLDSESP